MIAPIPSEEWQFLQLPDERLPGACVYEYCRSLDWLVEHAESCLVDGEREFEIGDTCFLVRATSVDNARIGRTKPRSKGAKRNENLVSCIQVFVRKASRPFIPFRNYDRVITLSAGFPTSPFLLDPDAFALLELHDGVPIAPVYDLKVSSIRYRLDQLPHLKALLRQKPSLRKRIWGTLSEKNGAPVEFSSGTLTEANGAPIEFSSGDPWFRKFTLAIDFSRTEVELRDAFAEFINSARESYGLKQPPQRLRPFRGVVPPWLNTRFCGDALNALAAHRVIAAFGGDVKNAFGFMKTTRESSPGAGIVYSGRQELRRSAKKYLNDLSRILGTALPRDST